MADSPGTGVASASVTAADDLVQTGISPHEQPYRQNRRRWLLVFAALVMAGFVAGAAIVELPYYVFRPGSVRDSAAVISVDGVRTYPPEGSISYTTVSLRPTTLFGLMRAWMDEDVEIVRRDQVLGDRDPEQNRQLNLDLMVDSQQTATLVALETLGYEVDVTISGQTIVDVQAGMPADGVLSEGDTIIEIDGEPIDELDALEQQMADKAPGDDVDLTLTPFSQPHEEAEVTLTLAPGPDDEDRGVMGVLVQAADVEFEFPVDVSFDTGDVGGPSAGLAFTLALIDVLTPGELTGGERVAVTGAIGADGTVIPVGGTAQKAAAVRRAGIGVFLVPAEDYADALQTAGDVEVIEVTSVDGALRELVRLGGDRLEVPSVGAEELAPAG
jgi:Lon-like protease